MCAQDTDAEKPWQLTTLTTLRIFAVSSTAEVDSWAPNKTTFAAVQ